MNYKGRINQSSTLSKGYVDTQIAGISFDTSSFTKGTAQTIAGTKTFTGWLGAGESHVNVTWT